MMEFVYAYAYFILYAFLGWVCEDLYCGIPTKKFINRGFFYGPYCPIYGVGALLVLYPLLFVKDYPILVFVLGVIITSALEYITSWVMEILFKTRWWDYSERFMNINGRVCLLNSTLFGIMSIVVIYIIHPIIQDIVMDIPFTALMSFLSAFTIGFGIDCVFTVLALLRRKQVFQKVQVQMEAFKKDFEAESQLRVQEAQEAFQEWMLSRPDLSECIEEFQSSLENFSLEAKKHISKAFPERHISTEIRNIVADGKLALERRRLNANKQAEYCELTNMVMIQDEKGNVLVQNSKNPNGYTLPTGHIELGESFVQSAMRDVKEKTGLNVEQLCLCGTKQFISSDNCRHIVFLYKTNVFNGIENEESKWIPLSNIHDYKLISGLNDVLEVFEGTKYNELYYNAQYQLKKY